MHIVTETPPSNPHPADALENPPVDPTTGHGRTAATVRRELAEYQDRVRKDPQCDLPPAVFNSRFLFVQLAPTLPIQLPRVSHGACITDARSADIKVTTTEYEHKPQPGVQGFFGTFTPKANPDYDPRDRRKGPMYLRHQDVDRSQIKVYDVQKKPKGFFPVRARWWIVAHGPALESG